MPQSGCETIVVRLSCLSVSVCLSVRDYFEVAWHCQFPILCNATLYQGGCPLRHVAIEIWQFQSTRTTAFVTTIYVSPKSSKCNISITNCQIALKFDTGVQHQKVHTKNCQWLDKRPKWIRDNTFCIPLFFETQISLWVIVWLPISPWIIVRLH